MTCLHFSCQSSWDLYSHTFTGLLHASLDGLKIKNFFLSFNVEECSETTFSFSFFFFYLLKFLMLLSLHFCCYLSFLLHSPFSYFIYCTPSVLVPANSLVSSIIVLEHCLIWPFSVWTNIYGPGLKFTPLWFFLLSSLMLSKWAFNFCLIPLLVSRFNLPFAFFLSVILSILCTGFFFFLLRIVYFLQSFQFGIWRLSVVPC